MLVDEFGRFLSQRDFPNLALLQVSLQADGLEVFVKNQLEQKLKVPFLENALSSKVEVWEDICEAWQYPDAINDFFSDYLHQKLSLVYMPDSSKRRVESKYAKNGEITSFSDGYPFLLIGQASLDDLNAKLSEPISMNRFRPNIVFEGGEAFEEDTWLSFSIAETDFFCAKPCARCVVTTISQETAQQGKEPLKTLSSYRKFGNKILFGQNLLHQSRGKIGVGDKIHNVKKKTTD